LITCSSRSASTALSPSSRSTASSKNRDNSRFRRAKAYNPFNFDYSNFHIQGFPKRGQEV
jgi:hypothetical protein